MINEINKLIEQYGPKSFGRLASCRPEIKLFLKRWNETRNCSTIGEQFFCIHYNIEPPFCICGNKLVFNTYVKGYWPTCGSKECKSKSQATKLSKFWKNNPNVKKTMVQTQRKTCLERYGTENIMQNAEKLAEIRDRLIKETGYASPLENPEVQEKCKHTLLKNHGVDRPFQSKEIRNKAKDSYLKNHDGKLMIEARQKLLDYTNGKNPFQLDSVKEKSKLTNLKKYGVEFASQNEEIKQQIQEVGIQTCLEKYGVKSTLQVPEIREKIKQSNIRKFGVENFSLFGLSEENREILLDKSLFETNLLNLGVQGLADKLHVYPNTIYKRHHKHGLNIIQNNSSSFEKEIAFWLENNSIAFNANIRSIIKPFELDFYLPKFNLAIEFDGLYWHSESAHKNKNYHLNKTNLCNNKNIRLVHIFEDEWLYRKNVCLDLLSRFLNITQNSIAARKCKIREISNKEAKIFLEANHLQGFASASVTIGLFYEGKLVQLMSFKHSRYNKNIEWENIRCANLIGHKIVGGIQRLWKYFVIAYMPLSVVSYCDKRWFVGESYSKLGFVLTHTNKPQYSYTDYKHRWHRSFFTKEKCKKYAIKEGKSKKELETATEKQIAMGILDLDRIWDCGQDTWIWNK